MNDYPSEAELRRIAKWPIKHGFYGLIEYLRPLFEIYGTVRGPNRIGRVYMATGGWSGNEVIIVALRDNVTFWMLAWQRSERGGAYWFDIPKFARWPKA